MPDRVVKEVESQIRNKEIKTSLFLINKLHTINKKYSKIKDPKIQNLLEHLTTNIKLAPLSEIKQKIESKIKNYRENASLEKASKTISQKIKNSTVVFLYGNPRNAINSVKLAKNKKIQFSVITSDSGTLNIGRETAKELAKSKIKVEHVPDFLIKDAVKKSDFVLIEAYAALKDMKLVVDIGADQVLKIAGESKVPAYCILDIVTADTKGILKEEDYEKTKHSYKEQNLIQISKAKTIISPEHLTAIVTQQGILKPKQLKP